MLINTVNKAIWASGVSAVAVCAAWGAQAQVRRFDVPSQAAQSGVQELGRQAGLQVLAVQDDLQGRRTSAVVGEFDAREGLRRGLNGSGLSIRSDDGRTLTLGVANRRGALTGRVLDPVTGEYMRNAIIRVTGADQVRRTTTSGERGEFRLDQLPTGSAEVSISFTGYTDQNLTVAIHAGRESDLDIALGRSGDPTSAVLTDIVVTATVRDGDARAIMAQRQSMDIKNSLSSESFGDISEGNIGEFLKFMPGVDTDAQTGADDTVRFVRLRGLPPEYTSITVNGVSIAGADALGGAGSSRAFSFEQASLSSIDSIEISKTISADVDANAPAGTINLRTKRAFDRRGRRIMTQIGATTQSDLWDDLATGPGENRGTARFRPTGLIEYSDVFLNRRLGVVASISQSNTHTENETIQIGWNYAPTTASPQPGAVATLLARLTSQEVSRFATTVNLDFRATDNLILSLSTMYNQSYNWSSQPAFTFTTGARARGVGGDPYFDFTTQQLATATTVTSASNEIAKRGDGLTIIPSFEYQTDRFTLDGNLSYSDSNSRYDPLGDKGSIFGLVNAPTARGNFTARRDNDLLDYGWTVRQISGGDWSDTSSYTASSIVINAQDGRSSTVERGGAALNFSTNLRTAGREVLIKTGLKAQRAVYDYENERDAHRYQYVGPLSTAAFLAEARSDRRLSFNESGFDYASLSGSDALYLPSNYKIGQMFLKTPGAFQHSLTAANYYTAYIENRRHFEEDTNAAYVMATTQFGERLTVRAGLRWEETETRAREVNPLSADQVRAAGHAVSATTGRATTVDGIKYQYESQPRVERVGNYDHLFPSASLKYALNDSTDLQIGYSRTIRRPEVSVLAGVWAYNDEDMIVTAPNPGLEPELSDNISVRLAKYFEPVGLVAINYFQNRIDGLFQTQDLTAEQFGYTGVEYADYLFRTTTTVGGEAINIHGMELEFNYSLDRLPSPWNGLTLRGSYTYTKPEMPISLTPENLATVALAYRKGPLRLNFNTVWADDKPGTLASGTYDRDRLDANLSGSYRLQRNWQAFFAVRNLFNQPKYRLAPGRENDVGSIGDHGANYNNAGVSGTIGLRATF